jgi:hypothetical protein
VGPTYGVLRFRGCPVVSSTGGSETESSLVSGSLDLGKESPTTALDGLLLVANLGASALSIRLFRQQEDLRQKVSGLLIQLAESIDGSMDLFVQFMVH